MKTGLIFYNQLMSDTILIIDDEEELCSSLCEIFQSQGFESLYTTHPLEAENILYKKDIDLILMDIRMPEVGGLDLLKKIRNLFSDMPIIMVSGYASIDNVIKCMKYGALNFYKKPLDITALLKEIKDFLSTKQKKSQREPEQTQMASANTKMQQVFHVLKTAAPTMAPVIITGESGTGKERIAMSIHEFSNRKEQPFVKINCAAIPDNLLESELFGYEAGAFTDARKQKKGKFELAHGGSIFFDEIGDMSLNTQAKLLRVLQEQEFERLGGTEVIKTDVRVIAATNKDFDELIQKGQFRDDLFYRISVINISLPPLRERKEDLQELCNIFLDSFNDYYKKQIRGFSRETMNIFILHDWPGNIRELKNTIERAVIFSQGEYIEIRDLGSQYQELGQYVQDTGETPRLEDSLNKKEIMEALKQANGSRQKAAELLNIHRKTLYNRMKKYGISEI